MKPLTKYIFEKYNTFVISDLEVKYDCMPDQEYIKFYIPESYSEDDFIIYIQDMYFDKMPAFEKHADEYFGKNAQYIYDVLFEYDTYEKGVEAGDCVEWDSNIDNKHNPDKEDFTYIQVSGLKYVIKFDEFEVKDESTADINNALITIFTSVETDKLPLELKLNEKNITYTEK